METTTTQEVIRQFIARELLRDSAAPIASNTPLIEEGYLTSLQTVELVLFLEETFGVEIEAEEVEEESFRSLATIAALVERKRGGA